MGDGQAGSVHRYGTVTIPVIWVALVLSLLFHGAMMWTWLPRVRPLSITDAERGERAASLVARLAPRATLAESSAPEAPAARPLQARPTQARRAAPPRAPAAPSPALPPAQLAPPVPDRARLPASPPVAPTAPSATPPVPARAPPEGDLSSYVEARRRARGESTAAESASGASDAPRAETEDERRNRIVAGNLASLNTPVFGYDARTGGGIFQIKRLGHDDAEFYFNGWNKDIRRKVKQLIEVRKGDNSDIRIAVIRRMIAIIREQEPGDFVWLSHRLGREIVLSARPSDNSGLEDFMMREFFTDTRQPY